MDQWFDHRCGDADIRVTSHLDTLERDDPARGGPHHIDQRQRLLPLLAGPLPAQNLETLGVSRLLSRRVVHMHGGLEQVCVARVTLRHTRDRRLNPVCRGLDPARQLDQRDALRLLAVVDRIGHIREQPVEALGELPNEWLRTVP